MNYDYLTKHIIINMKYTREKLRGRILLLLAVLLISAVGDLYAQNITIKGNVKDEKGTPVIGAAINVKGLPSVGIATDVNGNFSLSVPATAKQLDIKFIGMQSQTVNIVSGKLIAVVLKDDTAQLDEVVVIGYQTVRRKDLTGSVASVSSKTIAAMPVANVAQALQGKLPGVNVVSQDGRPDASVSIRIRGGGSISQSNEPLILVDGVIVGSMNDISPSQVESVDVLKDASSTAIYGARGANGVVLITTKKAKSGKASISYNNYVRFNEPTKYLESLSPYDYLKYVWANADANGAAYRVPFEKLYGIGAYTTNNPGGIESYKDLASDDIQKEVYNSSVSQNHDISLTGGSEKTKVLFSASYIDDQGMKVNSYAKRANAFLRINQKINDKIDVSVDTRYTNISNFGNEGTTSGSGSLLSSSYKFRPIATSHILGDLNALREGNMEQYGKFSSWDTYSPKARLEDYDPLTTKENLFATVGANWKISKGLTYHTDLTLNRTWNESKIWGGATYNNYMDDVTGQKLFAGTVDYQKSDSWGLRWVNTLIYEHTFAKIHKFNMLAGYEIANSGGNNMRITANHFPANFTKANAFAMINQYDLTKGTSSFSTFVSAPSRIISYFGRADYNLLDRYLLTFTFRTDGSSNFSSLHNRAYFPAVAAAWRVSDETFMKSVSWLDNLKLRLSYGEVGNDAIGYDKVSQMWASESDRRWQYVLNNQYQSAYDFQSAQMANPDLKWETTITRNLGIDFSLFKNRVWGTVDLYKNTVEDLLMQTSLPGITGFTTTTANIGQTSNKGLELSLSGVIARSENWNITAGANINFNKGNVDELADNVSGLYGTSWASSSTYPVADYILKVGSPVGIVRGLVYDGFYTTDDFNYQNGVYTLKQGVADVGTFIGPLHGIGTTERPSGQIAYPGVVKYRDLDNDGKVDEKDLTTIGNMNPTHTGGFNINATYKRLDLGVFFNWSYGNELYNVNKLASLYGYKETGVYENKFASLNNTYRIYDVVDGQLVRLSTPEQLAAANQNASLPLAYNENGVSSTLGIEDGSYLRLNNLTLGYTLPAKVINRIGLTNIRIYGSVSNLLTLTGYSGLDPEVNANSAQNNAVYPTTGLDWGTYPRGRSFVFGVNVGF